MPVLHGKGNCYRSEARFEIAPGPAMDAVPEVIKYPLKTRSSGVSAGLPADAPAFFCMPAINCCDMLRGRRRRLSILEKGIAVRHHADA
jgi:hypothetical protein